MLISGVAGTGLPMALPGPGFSPLHDEIADRVFDFGVGNAIIVQVMSQPLLYLGIGV